MIAAMTPAGSRHRQGGVTLIELMIVVIIIGVLLLLALPGYQDQLRKARRAVAKAELMTLLARQEEFFVNNRQYAAVFSDLGIAADESYRINESREQVTSGGIYRIALAPDGAGRGFSLSATPLGSQARDTVCGALQVTSTGVKSVTGQLLSAQCW